MVFPLQSNAYRMGSNSSAVPSIPQIKTATGQVRRGLQDITNSSQFGAAAGADKPARKEASKSGAVPSLRLPAQANSQNAPAATASSARAPSAQRSSLVSARPRCQSARAVVTTGAAAAVDDFDQADVNNPQMCVEYVNEIHEYLREAEKSNVAKQGYMKIQVSRGVPVAPSARNSG
jgi:hypothetical protein